MAGKPLGRPESELKSLIASYLTADESISYLADGLYDSLAAHDSLTNFMMRLTGKLRSTAFVISVSDQRFRWFELTPEGTVKRHQDYKLPLKGRLVLQQRGIIELFFPQEPRRFLTFSQPARARELYSLIDDQQQALQRQYTQLEEIIGQGTRPATIGDEMTKGEHGQTLVTQHETIDLIRPSFRPAKPESVAGAS